MKYTEIKDGVTAKRSKSVYLALSGESKSDGKLAQNLVFAVTPRIESQYRKPREKGGMAKWWIP
jgi:hypothetical protein